MKLTDATIAELRCPEGKKDALFFDDHLKGFGIRVMPDRADGGPRKVFLVQYRIGAKVRREPLGDWGTELTATQARKKAEALRGQVRDKRDPVAERRAARAAALAAEGEAKQKAARDAFTFGKLVDAWEARALVDRRPSYRAEATTRLRRILADWLDRPAAGFTRTDAATALEAAFNDRGPIAANRVMAYARACYGWAIKANLLEANPFANLAPPGREKARERVLSVAEVRDVWTAAEKLNPWQRGYVRFLLLTLQRREEVAGATWSEITPDRATWTVPAERAKNGRAQVVPLAPAARAELASLPQGARGALVFAPPIGKKISAFSAIKRALDAELAKMEAERAAAEGREPHPMAPWTFHDFRRAGVTALADQGFLPHVCDRLLNHVTGAIQGVAAVYQRAEFLAERKAALEAWAFRLINNLVAEQL